MLRVTGPPKKVTGLKYFFIDLKKPIFFVIHCVTSQRMQVSPLFILPLVIYFHAFSQYSVWQTMLLQESFENYMPSVKATGAAGRVLRTKGDVAA